MESEPSEIPCATLSCGKGWGRAVWLRGGQVEGKRLGEGATSCCRLLLLRRVPALLLLLQLLLPLPGHF